MTAKDIPWPTLTEDLSDWTVDTSNIEHGLVYLAVHAVYGRESCFDVAYTQGV